MIEMFEKQNLLQFSPCFFLFEDELLVVRTLRQRAVWVERAQ